MKQVTLTLVAMAITITSIAKAQTFPLKSKDLGVQFIDTHFANGIGCSGDNILPELYLENAPKETKAFAVTIYNLDAPTGSGLWHWVVYNIPATITSLASDEGSLSKRNLPKGAVNGSNDIGTNRYFGPCPPAGQLHQYIITVYALRESLQLEENASAALTGFMLNTNTIAKASYLLYAQK